MSRPELTDQPARAAALDAAERQMRAEGRSILTVEDWSLACQEFDRLCPTEPFDRGDDAKG